jgi:hypothetical protein
MGKIKHIRHAAAFCPSARSVFLLLLYAVALPMPADKATLFRGLLAQRVAIVISFAHGPAPLKKMLRFSGKARFGTTFVDKQHIH